MSYQEPCHPLSFFHLVSKNIFTRPLRTGMLVVYVAAVLGWQVSAKTFEYSNHQSLQKGIVRLGPDLIVVPRGLSGQTLRELRAGQPGLFYLDRAQGAALCRLPFVEFCSGQLYLKSLAASCCSTWEIYLVGFEPESDFVVWPWLRRHNEMKLETDQVLVGPALPKSKDGRCRFFGRQFEIVGTLDPSGTSFDRTVFIPLSSMDEMIDGTERLQASRAKLSAVHIRLKPEDRGGLPRSKAVRLIEEAFVDLTVVQPTQVVRQVGDNLRLVADTWRFSGFWIWPVTAVVLTLFFAFSAYQRRRELGLMRAMGAKRTFVFFLLMVEAQTLVVVGILVGVLSLTALALFWPEDSGWTLLPDTPVLVEVIATAAVVAFVCGTLAALMPAIRICRQDPYEAIRRGER